MDGYDPNSAVMDGRRMSDVLPTKQPPLQYGGVKPSQPFPGAAQLTMAYPFGQPRMTGGIGGLFSRLQGMDDETFNRGMDRYGQFRDRFGGGFQPNMFGSFAGMDDEGFNRGMERLSQYAERFGGSNPMFRNFRMPQPANEGDDMVPAGTPINGSAEPATGGPLPPPAEGNPRYSNNPEYEAHSGAYYGQGYGYGPATRPYYNTGFGSSGSYMPRNPYAGGYGMGYNTYFGGQSPFGRSGGGKGGGNPYSGRPAGGSGKGGASGYDGSGINPGGMYG